MPTDDEKHETDTPGGDTEALKQFLLRGWMTHDAMWFMHALQEGGIETANRLNRAAIRSMAPIEVGRLRKALGIETVENLDDLRRFIAGARDLLVGEFMAFDWEWLPPDRVRIRVDDCFAHKGMVRLGAIERYECGIYERIYGWLDALGVTYSFAPAAEHCLLHHEGQCVREFRFDFGGNR